MSQVSTVGADTNKQGRALRTPLDNIILRIATRAGGTKAKEVERFLKFAVVGTLGAVIDLGTSFVLMRLFFDPRQTVDVLIAATIAFAAAVMSNFTWNRYWTYPDSRSRPIQQQLVQFAIVSISGWTGRTIWLSFSKPILGDLASNLVARYELPVNEVDAALIGAMAAILMGIFVIMIWNFFVNRYWTYNDVD